MIRSIILSPCALAAAAFLAAPGPAQAEEPATATAVFGAGCFWCVEAYFEQQPGVVDVVSGYAGGDSPDPTYRSVGTGKTGHAEVVQVTFDPSKTTYEQLVSFFWKTHDPTVANGVWPDFGPQYRSIILHANDDQKRIAESSKVAEADRLGKPVATEIAPLKKFYPAEEYHQDYARKNPKDRYVRNITIPKLKKLGLKTPE